jgi:uracil phosphoribosyltransferase
MPTVGSVIQESRRRINARRALISGVSEETMRFQIDLLRDVMFKRRGEHEAFHPLSQEELAVLEHVVRGYVRSRRLLIGNDCFVAESYRTIRNNLLCGNHEVGPEDFRSASGIITQALIVRADKEFDIWNSDTTFLLPWRAGLAFAEAARDSGFTEFYHYGARRNEQTLETEIYFNEIPAFLTSHPERRSVVIADPMTASGNTVISALRGLGQIGVPQERTFILSVISAPEGVDHILQKFPGVRILTGRHDECLDAQGYIRPGLGDYGDWFFEGLEREQVAAWKDVGILNRRAAEALFARMTAASDFFA